MIHFIEYHYFTLRGILWGGSKFNFMLNLNKLLTISQFFNLKVTLYRANQDPKLFLWRSPQGVVLQGVTPKSDFQYNWFCFNTFVQLLIMSPRKLLGPSHGVYPYNYMFWVAFLKSLFDIHYLVDIS